MLCHLHSHDNSDTPFLTKSHFGDELNPELKCFRGKSPTNSGSLAKYNH